jgi:predicted deacylase
MDVALKQFTFQSGNDGPHLLITGGVHGDEFESIVAIRRLITSLESDETSILQGSLTCVPIVNESAFLRGHRCADDDLDLARSCPGNATGSITEQTAFALSQLIETADLYIDLHTGGTEFSVWPLAGYVLHKDKQTYETQRRMALAFNLPFVWGTAGNLDGRSLSVARDANVPAIYCEYLGAATCDPVGADAYLEGVLNVMAEFGMIKKSSPPNRVQHIVEDATPGSGHMQVCHPAPATGYFESAVRLGDSIEVGQPIGNVVDMTGERHAVNADKTGIVLVIRTFPRVFKGQSVGVIANI